MAVTVHYVGFHPTLILEGFEAVRVREPIERVYILYDGKTDRRDRYRAVSRRNSAKLARALSFFKPVKLPVNPLSYSSAFSRLYSILYYELVKRGGAERGVRVYIDVTDMPPLMAAVAGAVAMMFPNVEIYSVLPEVRGEFIPDPRTPEFDDWVEQKDSVRAQEVMHVPLPGRRAVALLDEDRKLRVLMTLYKMNGSAESVVDLMKACGDDPERNPAAKAAYSRLLREMEEEGLIVREQEGRSRRVTLTEFGRALVRALVRGEEMASRLMPSLELGRPALGTAHRRPGPAAEAGGKSTLGRRAADRGPRGGGLQGPTGGELGCAERPPHEWKKKGGSCLLLGGAHDLRGGVAGPDPRHADSDQVASLRVGDEDGVPLRLADSVAAPADAEDPEGELLPDFEVAGRGPAPRAPPSPTLKPFHLSHQASCLAGSRQASPFKLSAGR